MQKKGKEKITYNCWDSWDMPLHGQDCRYINYGNVKWINLRQPVGTIQTCYF